MIRKLKKHNTKKGKIEIHQLLIIVFILVLVFAVIKFRNNSPI